MLVLLVTESCLVFYAANDITEADVANVFLPGGRTGLRPLRNSGLGWLVAHVVGSETFRGFYVNFTLWLKKEGARGTADVFAMGLHLWRFVSGCVIRCVSVAKKWDNLPGLGKPRHSVYYELFSARRGPRTAHARSTHLSVPRWLSR